MTCILLFEYWIVEFLISEVVGDLLEFKKHLKRRTFHMNNERLKFLVLIVLLGDKQEAKWGDF